ncbi:MAG TPA: hypothetical protein VGC99_28120, partial [Candidatus Tectomicrobia bacterium]
AGLLGFLAGPMLGGWLSDASGQWLSSFAGRTGVDLVSMPFLVAAALGAMVWLLAYLAIPRHAGNAVELSVLDKPSTSHSSCPSGKAA